MQMKIMESSKTDSQSMAMKTGSMKHETIYYVLRYNLRSEAAAEYQQWLADHTGAQSEQAGWTYVGTFLDVMGVDRYDYETRWELNSHGSVNIRLLDTETEQRIQDRLPFVEEGQVALMKALNGVVPRGH
jgi:hypothetical protein